MRWVGGCGHAVNAMDRKPSQTLEPESMVSPLQEGILYLHCLAPASGIGIMQWAGVAEVALDAERSVEAFLEARQLPIEVLMEPAWAALLFRYTGEETVVIGRIQSYREDFKTDIAGVLGPLVNAIPVRVEFGEGTCTEDAVAAVRDWHRSVAGHGWAPLGELMRWSGVPPGMALFESIVGVVSGEAARMIRNPFPDGGTRGLEYYEQTGYPVTLWVEHEAGIKLVAAYDSERFRAGVIRRVLDHPTRLVGGMVRDPGVPLHPRRYAPDPGTLPPLPTRKNCLARNRIHRLPPPRSHPPPNPRPLRPRTTMVGYLPRHPSRLDRHRRGAIEP